MLEKSSIAPVFCRHQIGILWDRKNTVGKGPALPCAIFNPCPQPSMTVQNTHWSPVKPLLMRTGRAAQNNGRRAPALPSVLGTAYEKISVFVGYAQHVQPIPVPEKSSPKAGKEIREVVPILAPILRAKKRSEILRTISPMVVHGSKKRSIRQLCNGGAAQILT